MGVAPNKRDGVMFEHMSTKANSSAVTKASVSANDTTTALTMSSVSWLYHYFTFMSYFLGKEKVLLHFFKDL